MSDIIQKIEDHMDNIGEDYDSYGQALAHERAVDTLLPLLKKAIEDRDNYIRLCEHFERPHEKDSEIRFCNNEILELLGEKHE